MGVDSVMARASERPIAAAAAFAVGLLLHPAAGVALDAGGEGEPDAIQILMRMKKVYAGCRSYRDTGEVRTRGVIEGGSFASSVPFATAFVRPGPFRFQFTDRGIGERESLFIVWADGGSEVLAWWDASPGVRRASSLQEALEAASGISGGASIRVPGLLLPRVVGAGVLLVGPVRLEDDVDRGVWCYRVRGKSRETPYQRTAGTVSVTVEDEAITLWIDRATLLLRKVEEDATLSTYRSFSTTTYEPEIDVDVPAGQLAFDPPASLQPAP